MRTLTPLIRSPIIPSLARYAATLVNMHHRQIVGINTPPSGHPVQHRDRRGSLTQQRPSDMIFLQQLRELLRICQIQGIQIVLEKYVAVHIRASVDEYRHAAKNQVAAKLERVENRTRCSCSHSGPQSNPGGVLSAAGA